MSEALPCGTGSRQVAASSATVVPATMKYAVVTPRLLATEPQIAAPAERPPNSAIRYTERARARTQLGNSDVAATWYVVKRVSQAAPAATTITQAIQ